MKKLLITALILGAPFTSFTKNDSVKSTATILKSVANDADHFHQDNPVARKNDLSQADA